MIPIWTVDFETYYDKEYSLTKLTTEEYVNDPRFEIILVVVREPTEIVHTITGTTEQIKWWFDQRDWSDKAILCHNTIFDGSILSWHLGVQPRAWLDTLAMARSMFGLKGNSLAALAQRYEIGEKGTAVLNMMGRRRESLSKQEFEEYATYCANDVDLTYRLWGLMSTGWYSLQDFDNRNPFPTEELRIIDMLLRMYLEPILRFNRTKLEDHLAGVRERKAALLAKTGLGGTERLMSNQQFAALLESYGVEVPMKTSPKTGKLTYAFAKTDLAFKELLEHEDEGVQAVVAARLGIKSTIEETRTERFLGIASRMQAIPVAIKYAAAKTHRLGGSEKQNFQNLSSRGGVDAGKIKGSIEAPPGYVAITCDSSQIEARVLAWMAGQDDLVSAFANKEDVYSDMASRIYNRPINRKRKEIINGEETYPDEREGFVGKTVILGAGYQTAGAKLQATLKRADPPMDLPLEECERIIQVYRARYYKIPELWDQGKEAIKAIHDNRGMWWGREGVVWIEGERGVKLPSDLYISYPQLHWNKTERAWMYKDVDGLTNIYGGKFTENVIQALARIIVLKQALKIRKKLVVTLPVHDAITAVARIEDVVPATQFVEDCMSWVPPGFEGLPIACEAKVGFGYGEAYSLKKFLEMVK